MRSASVDVTVLNWSISLHARYGYDLEFKGTATKDVRVHVQCYGKETINGWFVLRKRQHEQVKQLHAAGSYIEMMGYLMGIAYDQGLELPW